MKLQFLTAALALTGLCAGCGKKQPESVPQPKAEAAAQAAAVSTAPVFSQNPLAAPGNYLKTTVGRVQEAKDAKALYEEAAKKSMGSLDMDDTGGN
ncbi:MAG TPA: hypothetical protein DEQ38_04970 [Elusimicrobia bacterium]|nr:MAG: hypothetical protein A2089_00930 [Elusimicrobia bacterium GWD2_63_28]HCC47454.1 hypothetical protein [Elusimicrobiota bacterium]